MAQATRELGFALEALQDLPVLEQAWMQDLVRERASDLVVLGAIDRTHRAFAETRFDLIAIGERLPDELVVDLRFGLERHQNLPNAVTAAPSAVGVTTRRGSFDEL